MKQQRFAILRVLVFFALVYLNVLAGGCVVAYEHGFAGVLVYALGFFVITVAGALSAIYWRPRPQGERL